MKKIVIEIDENTLTMICKNDYGLYNGRIYEMIRNHRPYEEQDHYLEAENQMLKEKLKNK